MKWNGQPRNDRERVISFTDCSLQIVLTIGQVLNRDSYLFNSDGFKLESLLRVKKSCARASVI